MNKKVTFFLVRHGETFANANKIISGITPTDLNDRGRQQAQDAAEALKGFHFSRAIASTLSRAVETAEIVLQYHPYVTLEQDKRLIEKNFGAYDGQHGVNLTDFWDRKQRDYWEDIGGETNDSIEKRCREALDQYVEEANDGDRILLCSHGNFSLVLITRILNTMKDVLGTDPKNVFPNGSILVFKYEDGKYEMVVKPKIPQQFEYNENKNGDLNMTVKKACEMTWQELGRYIDQSVLKPEFTQSDVRKYIQEGIDFNCATVCINPSYLDIAMEMTAGTNTGICVVVDFPFGTSTTESKIEQMKIVLDKCKVQEIDVVSNYGLLRSGEYDRFFEDVKAVADACHEMGSELKVILETDSLTLDQVRKGAELVAEAGADFVKSSTGFFTGAPNVGATNEVVQAMMEGSKGKCKIKGSGAIRTREHFLELIDMGIDRMGIGYKSTPVVLGITIDEVRNKQA